MKDLTLEEKKEQIEQIIELNKDSDWSKLEAMVYDFECRYVLKPSKLDDKSCDTYKQALISYILWRNGRIFLTPDGLDDEEMKSYKKKNVLSELDDFFKKNESNKLFSFFKNIFEKVGFAMEFFFDMLTQKKRIPRKLIGSGERRDSKEGDDVSKKIRKSEKKQHSVDIPDRQATDSQLVNYRRKKEAFRTSLIPKERESVRRYKRRSGLEKVKRTRFNYEEKEEEK